MKKPDADLNNILALIEFDRGKTEVAVLMFKKMTEQFPDFVPARMNLGVLYLKNRQLQLAAKQFERVLLANPSNSDAQLHLAVVKAHRGQANEAESALRKVLRRNKNNPLALFNLAVVLKNKGDKAESTELLQAYLKNAKNTTADGDKAALAMLEEMQKDGSESEKNVNIEQLAREAQEKRTQQANNKPDQKIADDGTLVIEEAPAQVPSNRKTNNSHAPAGAKDLGNDDSISDLESQLK